MGIQECHNVCSQSDGLERLPPHPVGGWSCAWALCRLSMSTEGCELSAKADACQRTFSPELANSMCAFSCRTALNAGAGLAWPLLEGANCVETGGALSRRFARVYWVLVHADYMSKLNVWWIVGELQKRPLEKCVCGLFSCQCRKWQIWAKKEEAGIL